MNLLNRIANYFANQYQGDDKTAPEFKVSVDDLREIANIHTDKCRAESELRKAGEIIRKLRKNMEQRWIPVSERLPESGRYILLSFDNFSLPVVGRYEGNKMDGGSFYVGDDTETCNKQDLFVNAWMPLPEPYQVGAKNAHTEKLQTNADRIRSMTDEELAIHMMCPNDTGLAEIECDKSDSCNCYECLLKWLQAESEE